MCTDDRYAKAEGFSLTIVKGCVPVDADTFDIPAIIEMAETRARVHHLPLPTYGHRQKFGDDPAKHRDFSAVEVTRILRERFAFRWIQLDGQKRRMGAQGMEAVLIGTLARCDECRPSHNWSGHSYFTAISVNTTCARKAHIGIGSSVPTSVPKRGPTTINRQPTPTKVPTKNGPEIVDFRPVL